MLNAFLESTVQSGLASLLSILEEKNTCERQAELQDGACISFELRADGSYKKDKADFFR